MTKSICPSTIRAALDSQRYETARRLAIAALEGGEYPLQEVRLLLHEALVALGDIPGARAVLADLEPRDDNERLQVALLLAEDYHRLGGHDFYRTAEENRLGLCYDEYAEKYEGLADAAFAEALPLADTADRKQQAAGVLRRCKRDKQADELAPKTEAPAPEPPRSEETGTLRGRLAFPDGRPVTQATVTIGFPQAMEANDPADHNESGIGGGIHATFYGEQESRTTTTDADGCYAFAELPALTYEFLSVTLDPAEYEIALRFFARDVKVEAEVTTTVDAVIEEWGSAPPVAIADPLPPRQRVATFELRNPFYYDFPRQFVCLEPEDLPDGPLYLVTCDDPETRHPVQRLADGRLGCFLELPARTNCLVVIYQGLADNAPPELSLEPEGDGGTGLIVTGRAVFRVPVGDGPDELPPILGVRGADGQWRGEGRLELPANLAIKRRRSEVLERGPLLLRLAITYELSNGKNLRFELTAHRDEPYLLVRETTLPIEGLAFEFSLREFSGGRGFLHWNPEQGNVHWTSLTAEERELARLQESVAWWIPPQGFGYAMTADGLEQTDYIGVFTRRRGEWIDREFERLAQGPGDENRELDWPFPEMVGSTISMITAHTTEDGDALFRFGGFDGERQWGLLVSDLVRNDGPYKEISSVQHKVSSPRLEDFLTWRLDEQDHLQRPSVVARRDEVRELRQKKETPAFAPIWKLVQHDHGRGPSRGLRALIEADPVLTWRLACSMRVEAPLRARMTLLGRDYADVYSPVGGRGITPFAEQYDLIAASGAFSPAEEREIRASLLLMGHMFMEEDFMNWRFNSRNANFEADRADIVGTVGLTFRGNPDADGMVRHAADLMERSLNVYCTPGSGKWYENPACYYLHAASCRLNLAIHLYKHDILDSTAIPRLKDFLSWGPLLLTAPYPHDYPLLRDGCDYETYHRVEKVRRVPPIGDHAKLGQWVSEFFALMGKAYRECDPEFADFLAWAYQAGGSNGGHFSKLPLFFTTMEEEDLQPAPPQTLVSRRLEGFGAVFRGNFERPNEFYLLFKQGPGGYRYHRTEGSFLLMAHGRPLVWDGGEAGETWRHSTLSFYDTHMPLAPGHVEQFQSHDSVDFVQGVHPKALEPGEPVFLSDSCEHTLVQVAWERFNESDPAVVRSVLWVKDEYVVIVDDLHLPDDLLTHWHLQVVSDAHAGDPANGYRFTGRYGVDLQVLLPGFPDAQEKVEQVPTLEYHIPPDDCFSMRHLQLSMRQPRRLFAVLRPLAPGQKELTAEAVDGGIRVRGDGIDDLIFASREPISCDTGDIHFEGRYGVVCRRGKQTRRILLDGHKLLSVAGS